MYTIIKKKDRNGNDWIYIETQSGDVDPELTDFHRKQGHILIEVGFTVINLTNINLLRLKSSYDGGIPYIEARREDYPRGTILQGDDVDNVDLLKYINRDIVNLITFEVQKKIKSVIDDYNFENGLNLDISTIESYSRVSRYPHVEFCGNFWEWNVNLWIHMRYWQSTLMGLPMIPTTEEVRREIDEIVFV